MSPMSRSSPRRCPRAMASPRRPGGHGTSPTRSPTRSTCTSRPARTPAFTPSTRWSTARSSTRDWTRAGSRPSWPTTAPSPLPSTPQPWARPGWVASAGPPRGAIWRCTGLSMRPGTARSRPTSPIRCWPRSPRPTGRTRRTTPTSGASSPRGRCSTTCSPATTRCPPPSSSPSALRPASPTCSSSVWPPTRWAWATSSSAR